MSNHSTADQIDQLFNYLDDFRQLPSYQLERRADIFFALYLKEILNKRFDVTIDYILPEFPLKTNNLSQTEKITNLSNKVDYLAVSKDEKRIFLVELKTDNDSLRAGQHDYLISAKQKGLEMILLDLLEIYKKTRKKVKYEALLGHLKKIGWYNQANKLTLVEEYLVHDKNYNDLNIN